MGQGKQNFPRQPRIEIQEYNETKFYRITQSGEKLVTVKTQREFG